MDQAGKRFELSEHHCIYVYINDDPQLSVGNNEIMMMALGIYKHSHPV